jgi:hypothetical protein
VFGTLKGRRFHRQTDSNKNFFFYTGIQKLVERCEKCIAKDGDYMERWHLIWICIYDVQLNITQFALTYWSPYIFWDHCECSIKTWVEVALINFMILSF